MNSTIELWSIMYSYGNDRSILTIQFSRSTVLEIRIYNEKMERWSDGIIRPEPNADHIIEGSFHRTMTRLMSWPEATNLEVKRLLVASLSLTNFEVLGRIEIKIATNPQGEDLKIQGTKADLLVVLATLNQLFPMRRGFCLSEGREFDIIEMASIDLGYCPSCRAILNVQI